MSPSTSRNFGRFLDSVRSGGSTGSYRFRILAALAGGVSRARATLVSALGEEESVLVQELSTLEEEGYVQLSVVEGEVRVRLTDAGTVALKSGG